MTQPLKDTLIQIEGCNDCEMTEILQAIIRRYGVVHPGWEIMFLSIPNTQPERRQSIAQTIGFLKMLP